MRQFNKTIRSKFVMMIYVLAFIMVLVLMFKNWLIGSIFLILFIALYMYDLKEEKRIRQERINHTLKLSTQVEEAGEAVFLGLPIGIVLYNQLNEIEWVNPYMRKLLGEESWRKQPLSLLSDSLVNTIENDEAQAEIVIDHFQFVVKIDRH